MLAFIKRFIRSRRRLFCKHERQRWIRDIEGGKRSVWVCYACGAYITREVLSEDRERGETTEEVRVYHWLGKRDRAELGLDETVK
jgi:hypothetical protein